MKQVISALQLAAIRTCLPWGILWFQNYIIRKGKINFSSRSQTFILFVPRLLNLSGAMMAENERSLIYFYCVTKLLILSVKPHQMAGINCLATLYEHSVVWQRNTRHSSQIWLINFIGWISVRDSFEKMAMKWLVCIWARMVKCSSFSVAFGVSQLDYFSFFNCFLSCSVHWTANTDFSL